MLFLVFCSFSFVGFNKFVLNITRYKFILAKLHAEAKAKEAENRLEADIRKYVTNDDKLVKAIIDDFDAADAIALAIFKALN